MISKYIRIMRIDHWIKQLFIFPGVISCVILSQLPFTSIRIDKIIIGFFATCCIASSNYVINEYLDAQFDKYHPTKKNRPIVNERMNVLIIMILYFGLFLIGLSLSVFLMNKAFSITLMVLWLMGIVYNVKPFRAKDIAYVDVLTESINNALRLLLGWFIISSNSIPPSSLVLGYWMSGAFLMSTKRYAEYKMIGDKTIAGKYRKSFRFYNEISLMASSLFYSLSASFFIGIFLVKYRIEMVLFMPFLFFLFCYYFTLSFKKDSAVQKPEKLYKEKGLMLYCIGLMIIFFVLMVVDIPFLSIFETNDIISF